MNLLLNILNLEFIIQNEYELDEIICKYGRVGNKIEEYLNNIESKNIIIERCFKRYEYYQIGEDESFNSEEDITIDEYFNGIDDNDGFYYFTGLNYSEFLNDFDFESFNSLYEQVVLRDLFSETINSIEEAILNTIKDSNAKMILNSFIQYVATSNWFLKKFRDNTFSVDSISSNAIQKKICNYFINYNSLLLENLRNGYKDIFPEFVLKIDRIIYENNSLNEFNQVPILKDILRACEEIQTNSTYYQTDENSRNRGILSHLRFSNLYITSDQSQLGLSGNAESNNPGEVDGIIKDSNQKTISYLEFFNLSVTKKAYSENLSVKNIITKHINKLENRYDLNLGLPIKFIVVYYNVDDNFFGIESNKYKALIEEENIFKFKLNKVESIEIPSSIGISNTGSKIFKSSHFREDRDVFLYHILLKFPKKNPLSTD